jgi:chromosome segregation ATPase
MKADQEIVLYIHPDTGPIRPMRLNITAVQDAANKMPDHFNKDEIRLREIVRQIHRSFNKVDPQSNMDQLRVIISRLSTAYHFNGMVVRLNGIIEEEGVSEVKLAQQEIEKFAEKFTRLQRQLASEQKAHADLKSRMAGLETQNTRLKILYERDHTQIAALIAQKEQAQQIARQTRLEVDFLRAEVDRLHQEAAQLTTRLDLSQKALQEHPARQAQHDQEKARLQREVARLKKAEQQLRETIIHLEQEREDLHERLRTTNEENFEAEARTDDDLYDL